MDEVQQPHEEKSDQPETLDHNDPSNESKMQDQENGGLQSDIEAALAEPETTPLASNVIVSKGKLSKFGFLKRKKVLIPAILILIVGIVFLIPVSRYGVLGMFISKDYSIILTDSQTHLPVSGAGVTIDSKSGTTDNKGLVTMKLPVGSHSITIKKQYYADKTETILVPLTGTEKSAVSFEATGRVVTLTVTDKLSGHPVENATVTAGSVSATTGKDGTAVAVLSPSATTIPATIKASGYSDQAVSISTTSQQTSNTYQLMPNGSIYILSDRSGTLDVVKINLDGSGRQTITSNVASADNNASLLASRDWKYIALTSTRPGSKNQEIDLIDTANGNTVTKIDTGDAYFSPVGWFDHKFLYSEVMNTWSNWQPGRSSIKSYDADSHNQSTLDSTSAHGTNQYDWQEESYGSILQLRDKVLFVKSWQVANSYASNSNQNSFNVMNSDGTNKKSVGTIAATGGSFNSLYPVSPSEAYLSQFDQTSSSNVNYEYSLDSGYSKTNDAPAYDYATYPTFLLSPSGSQTLWTTVQDGKNGLFVGDRNGSNKTPVTSVSDYKAFGWYTDNYLLISKNGSELYIMSSTGGTPQKITDYHKTGLTLNGYGGGYGGF